jgi:hypothetical protein
MIDRLPSLFGGQDEDFQVFLVFGLSDKFVQRLRSEGNVKRNLFFAGKGIQITALSFFHRLHAWSSMVHVYAYAVLL